MTKLTPLAFSSLHFLLRQVFKNTKILLRTQRLLVTRCLSQNETIGIGVFEATLVALD